MKTEIRCICGEILKYRFPDTLSLLERDSINAMSDYIVYPCSNCMKTKNSEAQRIETRLKEYLAFIKRVANWDFEGGMWKVKSEQIEDAQTEAFKLLNSMETG